MFLCFYQFVLYLDSELYYIDEYVKENPEGFVLISDLTSFIQVGDIVTFTPQKGLQIGELKAGKTNYEMFQIIENIVKENCPNYLISELNKLDKKKKEQLSRDIRQIDRSIKTPFNNRNSMPFFSTFF